MVNAYSFSRGNNEVRLHVPGCQHHLDFPTALRLYRELDDALNQLDIHPCESRGHKALSLKAILASNGTGLSVCPSCEAALKSTGWKPL